MENTISGEALVSNTNQSNSSNETQWIIVSKKDGKSKLLPHGMIFVGREECDIVLTSATVDKRHAVIFFNTTNQQFHVKDLNSTYGTYVNEKRIADQCYLKLEHSDRLRFGFGPDVFVMQKLSSLQLKSNISTDELINCANTETNESSDDFEDSDEEIRPKSDQNNLNKKSESLFVEREAQIENFEEQTSTPPSTPTDQTISHNNTDYSNSHTVSPTTQTISSYSENCENNSNSSLSTVDSLDEVKPCKRALNNKILSPVKESNEIALIKRDNPSDNNKNSQIVNINNSITDNNKTPASQACSQTSGPAMAFIIPFESEVKSNNKKKFDIKDSIRQFAPPKPDSIEKPRPQRINSNDLNKSDHSLGSHKSPTMFTKNKSNIRSVSGSNRSPVSNINELNGHLSDSATYLIHRMFCSETQNPLSVKNMIEKSTFRRNSGLSSNSVNSKDNCSPSNSGEKDSGVSGDNKSETGTYTVEAEHTEQDLEEARKKIDEIFGVFDDSNTFSMHSSPECLTPESELNSVETLLLSQERPANKQNPKLFESKFLRNMPKEVISDSTQNNNSFANSTFTRSKRNNQTKLTNNFVQNDDKKDNSIGNIRIERDFNLHINPEKLISFSNNKSNKQSTDSKTNKNSNNSYNTSHNYEKSSKNKINSNNVSKPVPNSHSAPSTPRSPLLTRKVLQLREIPKPSNITRRKNSWNHSNSDLDHYESYNSDESTDLSQKSSNSNVSKDGGNLSTASVPSKMRFNRAFALRRARLGIETPGIPVEMNRNKVNSNAKQINQKSNFSRNDGGRFSLRVTKNNNDMSRKNINSNNCVSKMSSHEKTNRPSLQRKGSDPISNKSLYGNRSALKPTLSDNDRYNNKRSNAPWIQSLRQNSYSNNNNEIPLQKSSSTVDNNGYDMNRNSDNNSVRSIPTFQVGKRFFSTKPHQMAQIDHSMRAKSNAQRPDVMSISMTEPIHPCPESPSSVGKRSPQHSNKSSRELSALDSLVVSAINQLSQKLKSSMGSLLEKERLKHDMGSETRVMIDELLPQVSSPVRRLNDRSENNISKDLSNILKSLKKVEQGFDVVSMLLDPNTSVSSRKQSNGFFIDI